MLWPSDSTLQGSKTVDGGLSPMEYEALVQAWAASSDSSQEALTSQLNEAKYKVGDEKENRPKVW